MAARYVRIGQHPDYRDEIRGTLSEILASTANPGTYAAPEDVTGTFLEMGSDGLWTGASVGYLTKAQADAVLAAQATKATLKVGVPAQVDGGPVTWRGAVAGWGDASALSEPPASGAYVGQITWVANPAVPRGRSRLEWTGTVWAPPNGELIVSRWRDANPVALVTPGATILTQIWASPVIPDYMLPANLKAKISGFLTAKNASGVSDCTIGIAISGQVPTTSADYLYHLGAVITPSLAGNGIGQASLIGGKHTHQAYVSVINTRSSFASTWNSQPLESGVGIYPFVSGKNRAYVMAKPSGVADQIQFDGISLVSEGNL